MKKKIPRSLSCCSCPVRLLHPQTLHRNVYFVHHLILFIFENIFDVKKWKLEKQQNCPRVQRPHLWYFVVISFFRVSTDEKETIDRWDFVPLHILFMLRYAIPQMIIIEARSGRREEQKCKHLWNSFAYLPFFSFFFPFSLLIFCLSNF